MDVRGKLGEVDDLRYAGTGDAGGAGNLGLVFDLAGILAGMRLANKFDVAALELYCRAYGDWRDACVKVAKLGQVLFTKKNGEPVVRRNPFDIVREKNAALCLKLLTEFGLTPSNRTRCQVQSGDEGNPFAEFLRRREERNCGGGRT